MTNQPPKDFLALSHGHEWVNFYESFDLLVQDHLTRSSELLRKAMSLPEVADREVAQVRDDLEMQIKTERERNHATLSVLQDEIGKSRENISVLAALATGLLSEIENLSSSVDAAISQATETAEAVPVDGFVDMPGSDISIEAVEEIAGIEAFAIDVSDGADAGETLGSDLVSDDSVSDEVTSDTGEESVDELAADSDAAWEQLAEEVDASADSGLELDGETDGEIDLNALAEAEQMVDSDNPLEDASAETAERSRPHWLNMARSNGNGS